MFDDTKKDDPRRDHPDWPVTGASAGLPFGRAAWYGIELLAEVALQEAFESLDVAGFVGLPPIKIFATLDFAYNFLQLFYNFESLHCNSFTTLDNFEELSARMLANA